MGHHCRIMLAVPLAITVILRVFCPVAHSRCEPSTLLLPALPGNVVCGTIKEVFGPHNPAGEGPQVALEQQGAETSQECPALLPAWTLCRQRWVRGWLLDFLVR